MDFPSDFSEYFQPKQDHFDVDITLNKTLQDTRHALQESQSEVEQLKSVIEKLYSESRIENVAVSELLKLMSHKPFQNIPLPRNADGLPLSEQSGYAMYYMKFLGHAVRAVSEKYHTTQDRLDGMQNSVKKNTIPVEVKRSGEMKLPELDGKKEMKRSNDSPATPPATPPTQKKRHEKQ